MWSVESHDDAGNAGQGDAVGADARGAELDFVPDGGQAKGQVRVGGQDGGAGGRIYCRQPPSYCCQ